MFCYLASFLPEDLPGGWLILYLGGTFFGSIFTLLTSAATFYWLYSTPTLAKWQYKTNPKFPDPVMVREEVVQTLKGMFCIFIWPTLTLYFQTRQLSKAYCPVESEFTFQSLLRNLLEFTVIVALTDLYEFAYHWCGHKFDCLWYFHRNHHKYYNPTPFSVVADEAWDNIWRGLPLFGLPLLLPLHFDLLMTSFLFFYVYGIYLHAGYEADWILPADHPVMNTSFQHYAHHAFGTRRKACHCGFFIKLWDDILGCQYDGPPSDAKSQREAGKRSEEEFKKAMQNFPNYSLLLDWRFMLFGTDDKKQEGNSRRKWKLFIDYTAIGGL